MADRDQPQQATHRAYSVIKREGKDDYWLNLGLAFPHKDGKGFNIMLQHCRLMARSSAAGSPRTKTNGLSRRSGHEDRRHGRR